jgi:hypothetical protein
MKRPEVIHPFGDINFQEETAIYTATSDWQRLSNVWDIKMYPINPISGESLEKSSAFVSDEGLWPSTWKVITTPL